MGQIPGQLFSPCFMTVDEYETGYKKSEFYVESGYMDAYRKHMVAMSHIAEIAKVYILKNWQKITDWGDLEVKITHGLTGEVTHYYNHERRMQKMTERNEKSKQWSEERGIKRSKVADKLLARIEERNKALHNPIVTIDHVVLDPTDGDLSVTINGDKEHWWIGDEEVIIIADYIEEKLKSEKKFKKLV
jgi:hypothetical protein